MSAGLVFEEVGRTFQTDGGRVTALSGLSLRLEPGSFTALVGPSGCGKSTLLHIAGGLDTQYQGTFRRTPPDAPAGCLFQTPRLLPWLSARDNVAFVLRSNGTNKSLARSLADQVLASVGLGHATRRYPAQLSGGMQQRVALARALAVEPAVLLMDEPFSGLDELTARRLREQLVNLYQAQHRTVLFVTHHIQEACFLADRVLVMSASPGRIVAEFVVDLPRPRDHDDPALALTARRVFAHIQSDASDVEPGGLD